MNETSNQHHDPYHQIPVYIRTPLFQMVPESTFNPKRQCDSAKRPFSPHSVYLNIYATQVLTYS